MNGGEGDDAEARRSPVFVDPSGRRLRLLSRVFWIVGGLMAAYVALVVVSLVAPPGLARLSLPGLGPVLPGPAAAPLVDPAGERRAPAEVLAPRTSASPSPRPSPSVRRIPPAPTASPVPRPAGSVSPSPSPTGAVGAASPSTVSTPAPTASRPAPARTPPGQASSQPTPRSSRAAPPRPSRSPR